MYTPFIADEKRDIVEYTSLGASSPMHNNFICVCACVEMA